MKSLILGLLIGFSGLWSYVEAGESIGQPSVSPSSAVVSVITYDLQNAPASHGSGFFVSADGLIVTARHVIENFKVTVETNDGRQLPVVDIVAEDPVHDLVIVRVSGTGYPFLRLGTFGQVQSGAEVRVFCDPYGFQGRVIKGTIAHVENLADNYRWLSINALTKPGESGAPVLDETGRVVGMIRANLENEMKGWVVSVDSIRGLLPSAESAAEAKPLAKLEKRAYFELYDDPNIEPALKAIGSGDYREAIHRLKVVCEHFPESGAAYVLLGSCYSRLLMRKEANESFSRAIAIKPDYSFALACLAETLAYQGNTAGARETLKRAIEAARKQNSHFPDTMFNIGGTCVLLNDYNGAQMAKDFLRQLKTPEADDMANKINKALSLTN